MAIVGAGPVGLAMALGLARHGVRTALFEKGDSTSRTSKAPGVHVRTLEILRQWGIEPRFREAGTVVQPLVVHSVVPGRGPLLSMDFREIADEADRPGLLLLEQSETERLLLEAVAESGMCDVHFGAEVVGLEQGRERATLTVRGRGGDRRIEASFVVGCDGAGSFVRGALELPFDGKTYPLRPMLADVRLEDIRDALPWPRAWTGHGGFAFAARLSPGLWRIVSLPRGEPRGDDVTDEQVREQVDRLLGSGPAGIVWSSRFRIHVRSAPRLRVGRVLLAGDAAHVHSPASGQGMNGGIQDAHNLAWKLAHAIRGGDVDRLLDSYDVERRAVVGGDTSRYTDRITRFFIDSPTFVRVAGLAAIRLMLRFPRLRRRIQRRITMIDLSYPPSPLLRRERAAGVRLPNPLLRAADGRSVRLDDLLPKGPVLIEVAERRLERPALPVGDVIRVGPHGYEEPAGLLRRLLGGKDGWILVRPDAYVAWARRETHGMEEAVRSALGWPGSPMAP